MTASSGAGRVLVATTSVHKAAELGRLLAAPADGSGGPGDGPFTVPLRPVPGYVAPDETGATFEANARLKAAAGRRQAPGAWVVADDSGLVVPALGGAPGVHSARFGGEGLDDAGRVALLLERLAGAADRRATFVCVLVAVDPSGEETLVEGRLDGTIADEPRGQGGFGYDPVFVPEGFAVTVAELPPGEKDAISHRGRAARALRSALG